MGLAIKTIECNGGCSYCYEHDLRNSGKYPKVDMDKIMETLRREIANHKTVTIHGGEPLMLGKENVDRLLHYIHEVKGRSGIQTNGILIDDEYFEMFKQYNTHVGFSIDGIGLPENSLRWDKESLEKNVNLALRNLVDCQLNEIRTSVIAIVHKKSIKNMYDFTKVLFEECGITSIRVNPCIFYGKDKSNEIGNDELSYLYKDLYNLSCSKNYDIRPIADVKSLLIGKGESVCTFSKCDPFHTTAEVTILGDGSLGGCLKNYNQNGLTERAEKKSNIRYEMLKNIPMDNGGCKECSFWILCKGGCPGAGIDDDWRNKSRFCDAYYDFFYFMYKVNAKLILESRNQKKGNYTINRHGDIPHGDHTDRALLKGKK